MDPTNIARIAHEADRTWAALSGDLSVGGWNQLEPWQRHSAVCGVKVALLTPGASAEELHASWRRDKQDAGWALATALDVDRKQDPLLVPWAELTPFQRRREELFLAIVRALAA